MMGFSVAVIVVLWVLQILFLDEFYYYTTKGRMQASISQLTKAETAELPKLAGKIAVNRQLSIRIFRIENIDGENSAYSICQFTSSGSILNDITQTGMNALYDETVSKKGALTTRLDRHEIKHLLGVPDDMPMPSGVEIPDRLIVSAVQTNADGELLYILLDTPLTPVDSTVSTLKNQLIFVTVALLLLSIAIAFLLSTLIARPIKKLSKAAKELANGNYAADFSADGYREVVELSDTLTYAADEIAKVDRLQKELLANISHDLRTPLTMIIGYGEVMRDIDGENTPENVQVIIDEAERLNSLVNDLLEISSYQANNESIARDALNISETLTEVAVRYQHLKDQGGYTFRFEGDDGLWIYADKKRILQVICNLVNNAVNYAGEDKTVILRASSDGEAVRVSVTDHGRGIPENELANIWERYYKLDKTHTRGVTGSGLGLSIVRRILELHGARYGVESQLGVGSTFWFELPCYKPNEE